MLTAALDVPASCHTEMKGPYFARGNMTRQEPFIDRHEQTVFAASDTYPRNMGADIMELADGRLFLAFSQWYTGTHDTDDSRVMGVLSDDGGRCWSEPFPVAMPFGPVKTLRMPSMIRRRDGRIVMLMRCRTTPTEAWVGMTSCTDESAVGESESVWSTPVRVSPPPPGRHIALNNRLVRLSTGRLLLAVSSPWPWDREDVKGQDLRAWCLLSDDDAETWQVSRTILAGPGRGAMEPYVVERRDGHLLMLIRTDAGFQYRSISHDQGETWTDPVPQRDLLSVQSPCAVRRAPSLGALIIVWNQNRPGAHARDRTPLTIGISHDEGESWSALANLETDPERDFSYPSLNFIGDRTYVTYYERQGAQISLKLQSFVLNLTCRG